MALMLKLWYNHEMRRHLRSLALLAVIGCALVLYREWVMRSSPPIFLPLGFFESASNIHSPEDDARDPRTWIDPLSSLVVDDATFTRLTQHLRPDERKTGILVTGATFGGIAAALSAAEDGVPTILVTERDWTADMRAAAGRFFAQKTLPDTPGSEIESALRTAVGVNGTPASVTAFFKQRAASAPLLDILEHHVLLAFARSEDGALNRALLRHTDGSGEIIVRFEYVIDGTLDGSTLASTGTPTRASWDESADGMDVGSLSARALSALTEGYEMSGYTIPGLGKRIENASAQLGVIDRGFHGTFAPVADADDCWGKDGKAPLISTGTVLRTKTIGCTARMWVESSFEDTVELFLLNHGDDGMSADIALGTNTLLSIDARFDPAETFVRLGAFPVGPESPIAIELRSVLPTNRLEGIVARKLNTGSAGMHATTVGNEAAAFVTNDWRTTAYDIYVATDSVIGIPQILIDERPFETVHVGRGTYAVRNVPLGSTEHTVRIPGGDGMQHISVIPVQPIVSAVPLTILSTNTELSWAFTPTKDGTALVTIPAHACETRCTFTVRATDSSVPEFRIERTPGEEMVAQTIPVEFIQLHAGKTYVIATEAEYDRFAPPVVSMTENDATLHASGNGSATVTPPREGLLYDIWTKSARSPRTIVTAGGYEHEVDSSNDWRYVTTELLSSEGAIARAGGHVEILALPNTKIDAYHLPLHHLPSGTPPLINPLPGRYQVASYGIDNPTAVIADNERGAVQTLSFAGKDGTYHAEQTYLHSSPARFSLSSPWPQRLVLYERIMRPMDASVAIRDATLHPLDGPRASSESDEEKRSFIFEPRAHGIGPVTIGTMHSPSMDARIRASTEDAFFLLRMGKTNIGIPGRSCAFSKSPRCDMRRFVRNTAIFGTNDGLASPTFYPEGRRLIGTETLTTTGAYALRQPCSSCLLQCLSATSSGSTCVMTSDLTVPQGTIVSVRGAPGVPSISSPQETAQRTLASLFEFMRRDQLLEKKSTYLEQHPPLRDISLTLGMLMPAKRLNILAGSTTVSTTAAAAKSLRLPTTELAIGSAAGHAAAFSLREEHSPLWLIMESPDAYARLQQYLVNKGVRVLPVHGTDELSMKAVQRRILDGDETLSPQWTGDGVTFVSSPFTADEQALVFGGEYVRTVREALERLPGSPEQKTPVNLFRFGMENGFLNKKMLNLTLDEIMNIPLDETFLLKADYLLHAQQ